MSDERIDLSALDPSGDERFERMVRAISWRARGELARRARRSRPTMVDLVASWYRPALAAAAVIALVSVGLLAAVDPGRAELPAGAYMSAAEVPEAMSVWYEEDRLPTASELLVVVNQGDK